VAGAMPAGPARGAGGTRAPSSTTRHFARDLQLAELGDGHEQRETGTITCNGPVNGKQPTGPGKFGVDGRYGTKGGATCQRGGALGVIAFTIRPRAGRARDQPLHRHLRGLQNGVVSAQFEGTGCRGPPRPPSGRRLRLEAGDEGSREGKARSADTKRCTVQPPRRSQHDTDGHRSSLS